MKIRANNEGQTLENKIKVDIQEANQAITQLRGSITSLKSTLNSMAKNNGITNLNKQIISFLIIFAIADFIACWISIFKYKAKIKNDARYLVDLDNEIEKYENEKSRN